MVAQKTENAGISDTKAVANAGYVDPSACASRVINRPRVQAAIKNRIADYLPKDYRQRCSKVLTDGLKVDDPNCPVSSQRERRSTVETIAKLTGELIDIHDVSIDSPILIAPSPHTIIDVSASSPELVSPIDSNGGGHR